MKTQEEKPVVAKIYGHQDKYTARIPMQLPFYQNLNRQNGAMAPVGSSKSKRCWRIHERQARYPAFGKQCFKCSKWNHFAAVCETSNTVGDNAQRGGNRKGKIRTTISTSSDDGHFEYAVKKNFCSENDHAKTQETDNKMLVIAKGRYRPYPILIRSKTSTDQKLKSLILLLGSNDFIIN